MNMWNTVGRAAFIAGMVVLPLSAQQTVTIRGVVKDTAGVLLSGAEVVVGSATRLVETGASGSFLLEAEPGRQWLYVRRWGYAPMRHALTLRSGSTRRLEVILEPLPQELPELEVQERSGLAAKHVADYWGRSYVEFGRLFTRDDIELFGTPNLRQLVRQELPLAPLSAADFPFGFSPTSRVFRFASSIRPQCPPAISVDGAPPFGVWFVDDFRPENVEALEVYRPGLARVPTEFAFYSNAEACGLVIVWQR